MIRITSIMVHKLSSVIFYHFSVLIELDQSIKLILTFSKHHVKIVVVVLYCFDFLQKDILRLLEMRLKQDREHT
jgi:hypothetical protein